MARGAGCGRAPYTATGSASREWGTQRTTPPGCAVQKVASADRRAAAEETAGLIAKEGRTIPLNADGLHRVRVILGTERSREERS